VQADWTLLTHTTHKDTEQSTIEASITLDSVTLTDSLIKWSSYLSPSVCREITVSADKMFLTSNKPAKWTPYTYIYLYTICVPIIWLWVFANCLSLIVVPFSLCRWVSNCWRHLARCLENLYFWKLCKYLSRKKTGSSFFPLYFSLLPAFISLVCFVSDLSRFSLHLFVSLSN
jgi:hypothetical protein